MKKLTIIMFLVFISLIGICQTQSEMNYEKNKSYGNALEQDVSYLSIGDTFQGGIVFYLDSNGGGLIAAPTDQSTGASWGCGGTIISGADGTAIGTGYQNTVDIEAGCPTAGTAADICANLTLGGYSDWFLPSKDELELMWTNLANSDGDEGNYGPTDINNLGGFANSHYLSSTERVDVYGSTARGQDFMSGKQSSYNKNTKYYVRAIRAF